ncbi:MAG: pilus assembly protein PilE [Alphaproteobacteria bacterium]|nr:MAG: pilus assembly protein PilE [Alphaproteobacteria bacterium]
MVAILAAIAYPAYVSQIEKGRRAECRGGLLQAMQQQERYFTQYNRYVAFTVAAASAPVRTFSGDAPATSSCFMAAIACSASKPIESCVEMQAVPQKPDSKIEQLLLTSDGEKACQIGGARTTANKTCGP